jgi:hypothetical protein
VRMHGKIIPQGFAPVKKGGTKKNEGRIGFTPIQSPVPAKDQQKNNHSLQFLERKEEDTLASVVRL